jgi:hypothetical protein
MSIQTENYHAEGPFGNVNGVTEKKWVPAVRLDLTTASKQSFGQGLPTFARHS